jgi:hypothetical protein
VKEHVRKDQVRKVIKSSIIVPLFFYVNFFKFQEKNRRKGGTLEGLGDERTG